MREGPGANLQRLCLDVLRVAAAARVLEAARVVVMVVVVVAWVVQSVVVQSVVVRVVVVRVMVDVPCAVGSVGGVGVVARVLMGAQVVV